LRIPTLLVEAVSAQVDLSWTANPLASDSSALSGGVPVTSEAVFE